MPRVVTTTEIEQAAAAGRRQFPVTPDLIIPSVVRQKAEQLGVQLVQGGNGASASPAAAAPPSAGNGRPFTIPGPGGRSAAVLPTPVPVVQPPSAPSTVFRTPPDAPIAPPYTPPPPPPPPRPFTPPAPAAVTGQAPAVTAERVTYPPPAQLQGKYEIDIKPEYFKTPGMDNIYTIAMELAAMLWVARDRIAVIEELLAQKGIVTEEDVELYDRPPSRKEDARKRRAEFIERIFGILKASSQ